MKKNLIKTKDVVKKILLVFLIMLTALMSVSMPTSFISYADDNVGNSLDTTDPLTDLKSDSEFNILAYPFNKNGNLELKFFNEYCYSFYTEMQENFALYVYIYNPQALEILDSPLNKIQMAVGYDAKGNPNNYEKFELKLCSFSSEYDYYRLFYKFKVVDHLTNGLSIYDRLNSNERRYDVSGIELVTPNSLNATDKGVSKTYYYTGYAKGYGPNFEAQESTLKQRIEQLDTVELNVQHTFWRSETSNTGANYQNQLDTVYFTVPNKLLEEYGKLQRIKAEWYEYKTKDIIVTSNKDFYNAVWPYVGTPVGGVPVGSVPAVGGDVRYNMSQDNSVGYGLIEKSLPDQAVSGQINTWLWNDDNGLAYSANQTLYYLLPTADWKPVGEYDPYGDTNNVGDGTKDALLNYILRYDKSYTNGTLPIKNGTISADLFESDIDDYRKIDNEHGKIQQGYSYYDFDASVDILEWKSYKPDEHEFYENIEMFGFWNWLFGKTAVTKEDFSNVSPILLLEDESTVSGLPIDISKRLHVNINDANKIRDLYYEAQKNDETVVLFRFALTDYYSAPLIIDHFGAGSLGTDALIDGQAYRAVQSVFFDFDIIQLTFQKEEVLTVVPVISNPIDIVNNPTPPTNLRGRSILEIILAWAITIVASILGIVLGCYVYKLIVQIYSGSSHIVAKILMTIPIVAVVLAICIWVIPWVVRLVLSFGGL